MIPMLSRRGPQVQGAWRLCATPQCNHPNPQTAA